MSGQTLMIVAIALFALTYILMLVFSKRRAYITLGAAVLFVILGIMPADKLLSSINWDLLLMIGGIMGTVALFIESKMPAAIGDRIIRKVPDLKWAVVLLSLFAGFLSAFVDNVATVLIMAPIAIDIARKTETSPVLPVIAIAITSNLQGAATLVGDATSILLGAEAGMTFFDFFFFKGRPGLFWVIQISMLLTGVFLLLFFRKNNKKFTPGTATMPESLSPAILLLLSIALLIAASFIPARYKFQLTNGIICVSLFIAGLICKGIKTKNAAAVLKTFKSIDYPTLLLIGSLFVIIGGIQNVGIISAVADFFVRLSADTFTIYTIIVFASVLLSAFIDNIPYVAAMLPVVSQIAAGLGTEPYLLYFGLICGATLGGNLTPIGASANITALGILRKEGHKVKAGNFMKISVPFTLIAVTAGYGLIWLLFH